MRSSNDEQPDCFHGAYPVGLGSLNKVARSRHPGGVNVILGDGSVKFVRNQVDLHVWQALNTRAGQERIAQDSF
jgi:prepilin-type processing-associated H-X9-DG protein